MARGLNKVQIIGRLGRDPEMKYTPKGSAVTTFSVATSRQYKNAAGEKVEDTEWFNCEAWSKLAEIVNQFGRKGQLVYCEGRQKTDKYEKDGATVYRVKMVCDTVNFLDNKGEGSAEVVEEEVVEGEQVTFA